MPKFDYDLIVIGAGAGGLTCSTGAGSLGAKVLLVEKEKKLGGDCLHYGCVPSKSLIKSAYAYNLMRHAEKYGLPKIDLKPVDFLSVAGRIRNIIDTIQIHDSPEYLKDKYNVDTKFGFARFLDDHTISVDSVKITAKDFVVSTGSSPLIPAIEGIKDVPYITNVDIFSLEKLPASLIVLGGGPIGLEMAQAFARLGSKVTVIQSGGQLLPKEDEDVAQFVRAKLEREGIVILLNAKAKKITKQVNGVEVLVHQEEKILKIFGETLLVAAGRKPNLDGLDLEKVGVVYDRSGIKVDNRMRTSTKNIFACGDSSGGYLFTHVASYEAGIAMMNILYPAISFFHLPVTAGYSKVPWVTYLDPEVASVGLNEKRAKESGTKYILHKQELKNDRALAESESEGFIKLLINERGQVLGVQIVSFHAGDLIHEWVAAMNGKMNVFEIANSIHAYPTMSEINRMASLNYFAAASHLRKLRMLLNI